MIDKEEEDKMKLFDTDEEGQEDENYDDDFKIRPQYEGPHGLQMLEMNAELSKRFKFDERFAEDFAPEISKKIVAKDSDDEDEKEKNIRILETVLGHEVRTKTADKNLPRKRLIRYDPEDEDASKYVKVQEDPSEKPKKSKKKKEKKDEVKAEEPLPISTERYIEVCPNLKEIMTTSTPFSFSQKFNFDFEEATPIQKDIFPKTTEKSFTEVTEESMNDEFENKKTELFKDTKHNQTSRFDSFKFKSKDQFFISKDDPRLKEGIEFFKRPKPLDEIRVEWQRRRERVLELFRRKRKSSQRSHAAKVKTVQMKYKIRNTNFKK